MGAKEAAGAASTVVAADTAGSAACTTQSA